MKTLYEIALAAVPNPGLMAETYLVPHHPIAVDLQARQYEEDRNKYREQHRVLFRYVYADLCFIEANFSQIKPSNVAFLNRLWKEIDDLLV